MSSYVLLLAERHGRIALGCGDVITFLHKIDNRSDGYCVYRIELGIVLCGDGKLESQCKGVGWLLYGCARAKESGRAGKSGTRWNFRTLSMCC